MIKKKTVVSFFSGLILEFFRQDMNNEPLNGGHTQMVDIVGTKKVDYSDAILVE